MGAAGATMDSLIWVRGRVLLAGGATTLRLQCCMHEVCWPCTDRLVHCCSLLSN
jgi:hypothetical protein